MTAYGANKIYANAKRARMVGVQPTILGDFLMGAIKDVKTPVSKVPVSNDKFVNLPYTVRYRTANISNEYFQVTAGVTAGANGLWDLTISTIPDSVLDAPSGAPIYNQFLVGQYIYVQYADETAGVGSQTSYKVPFKVVSSVAGGSDTEATVQVIPSVTAAGWAALTAPEQAALQPEKGVVTIGLNNVDDYEKSCATEAVELAPQHIIDYHQTSRNAFCYTDEFLEMDKAIAGGDINDYYSTFRHLPVTEQNRIREKKFQDKWAQAIFFNGPLNELQDPNAYTVGSTDASLTVVDPNPDNAGCILGYKANALGIRHLLKEAGQVLDFGGGELDLNAVFDALYSVKRNREIDGQTVTTIGGVTSRKVYDRVVSVLIAYIKSTYGIDNLNQYFEKGEVINHMTSVAMKYMKFDLPEWEFEFVIASDNFFTDQERLQVAAGQPNHAGQIWFLDWSDLTVGIVETNSQKIDENDEIAAKVVDEMKCTMKQNTIHRTLESTTWTVLFGNEKRSLLVEGFNPQTCIALDASTCTPA